MSNLPLVSICIPTFNQEDYIEKTIKSIFNQRIDDIEIIVLDDASTDNTFQVVNRLFKGDSRATYIRHERNLGGWGNNTLALKQGVGKYRLWLHGDDWLLPNHLISHIEILERNSHCVLAYSPCYWSNTQGRIQKILEHPGHLYGTYAGGRDEVTALIIHDNYITPSSVVFQAKALENFPLLNPTLKGSDWDLFLRLALQYEHFAFVSIPSTVYRVHGAQSAHSYFASHHPLRTFVKLVLKVITSGQGQRLWTYREVILSHLEVRKKLFLGDQDIKDTDFAGDFKKIQNFLASSRQISITVSEPLVTIIIPTFNRPELLQDAIHSLIEQTYSHWEVIVVNDAGANVGSFVLSLDSKQRVRYIDHARNRGLSAARNTGLALARGEIVCFLDDDDRFLPDHLKTVVPELCKQGVELVYTDARYVHETVENGQRRDIAHGEPYKDIPYSRDHLLVENFIPVNTWALRRELALKAGQFDEKMTALEDWEYLLRLTALTQPHPINKTTVEVRIREDIDQHMSRRERHRFLPLYKNVYERHPSASPEVQAGRKRMLAAFEKELSDRQDSYTVWFNRHRWSKQACQRLKELSDQWRMKPLINILIIAEEGNPQKQLADTIGSLAKQTLGLWKLTVITSPNFDHTQFSDDTEINWVETDLGENATQLLVGVDLDSEADWVLICEPGTCFESVFCNLVGELINRNPEWRFVYTDEDHIDEQGNLSKPYLKPDCNLDLLRSSGYVGHACLIHSDLWRQIPANERINSLLLLNYAAALRCYEIFGETAIGHVDEILFHYPLEVAEDLKKFEESGKIILQEHLWRQGIFAEVAQGLVEGSFFVDYPLLYSPLVSIIIPTRNRFDLLQPCIESLLDKTRYSNYELIIIDNLSDDSATLEYFSYLKAHDQRIKIILYPKEYNYSAINNFAARQANGDFILFLNNDTVVLQENWLERLVSIGLRDDVGVVGCRLVYTDQRVQHAGVIIGLGGVAEYIGIGLPMSETGYMGRAQLTQNFSAVTAACMLVRKDLFFDVGGLDEKDFSVLYNDIDLCLKVGERGYRIVWTPFVTLIHHGNSSLKTNPDPKRDELNFHSRKAFIKKWFPRLGNDPAYNRHLSLRQREWMIDGDFDVPWHPGFEPLPRIVAQPPDEMGVGQYRMIGPLKALTDSGRVTHFLLPPLNSEKRFLPFLSELSRAKPTVLFFQNAFTQLQTDDLQAYAELLPDVFRVFGQDDIVFSIPQKSAARKHFGKDTKARVRKAVSLCHRAIVTTEPIAEAMRGMVDDIRVVPNYLERSRWGDLQSPRKERRKLRVGWAGAQQHQGDLEFILPVVEATANEVDWIFMGLCPPKLRYHVAEAHNAVPFDQYPAALAALDLDLAIAPLEINRFNVAKSNLRLLEYGALGYPVICTDIEPYRNAPVTRVPNNPKAWIDAIRAHVHEVDATRAAGEQLREWVLSNWMLDQHLNEWLKALLPD